MSEEKEFEKELFIALVRNSEDLVKQLEAYIIGEEYNMASNGGEPDLTHLLALRLLEKMKREPVMYSIVYSKDYREHIEKNIKKEEEEK